MPLERFVAAQDEGGTYDRALRELRAGRKTTHWVWFVLPQVAGLGRSSTAVHYALADLDEARAYLAHPVLGPRLRECAQALLDLPGRDAPAVLGGTDAQKLHSSMTLFEAAGPDDALFPAVLERYFAGQRDAATLECLQGATRVSRPSGDDRGRDRRPRSSPTPPASALRP